VSSINSKSPPFSLAISDLAPTETAGYRIGEKKSLAEYNEVSLLFLKGREGRGGGGEKDLSLLLHFALGWRGSCRADENVAWVKQLDKDDESLQKWKQSLGLGASGSAAGARNPLCYVSLRLYWRSEEYSVRRWTERFDVGVEIGRSFEKGTHRFGFDECWGTQDVEEGSWVPSRPVPRRGERCRATRRARADFYDFLRLRISAVVIKEGAEYAVEIVFKINNTIVSGLRYIQAVKRAGIVGTFWRFRFHVCSDFEAESSFADVVQSTRWNRWLEVMDLVRMRSRRDSLLKKREFNGCGLGKRLAFL